MKKNATAKAFVMSLLALMMCLSMLVGTTFAWFTDSVTSGVNKIVAGNLDVELEYAKIPVGTAPAEADWKTVQDVTDLFMPTEGEGSTLWEPGHTEYVYLRIRNAGTLALKYQFAVNVYGDEAGGAEKEYTNKDDGTFRLSDYLVFNQIDGAAAVSNREELWLATDKEAGAMGDLSGLGMAGVLNPGEMKPLTLAVYMPTSVGNEANYKTGTDTPTIFLGLDLTATQTPHESDSFGNDYDRIAALIQEGYATVGTAAELQAALTEGKNVILTDNITTASLSAPEGTVVDGNGKTITGTNNLSLSKNVEYKNINFALSGGWGVIVGGATFTNCTFDKASPYFVPAEGDNLVVEGCTFVDTILQICYNEGGKKPESSQTIIRDNTFLVNNTDERAHAIVLGGGSPEFWANGAETVTVTGNTFTPRNSGTTYIAYYVYGDYGTTLTSVPMYNDNVYNGDVNYAMNSTEMSNQHPLSRESGIFTIDSARKITVSSANGLKALNGVLNEKAPSEGREWTVDLTADIDLAGESWEPISKMWIIFNGNGHTISNISCEGWRTGLFGYAGAVTINDLTLENVTSTGAQAGTFAGSGEGLKINNCYLKGTNHVTYQEYATDSYTETWGGVGAVTGILQPGSNLNVEIVAGATVEVNKTDLTTQASYVDDLTGYIGANNGTIINNGTVTVIPANP